MEVRNNKQLGEMGERVAIGELAKYGIDVLLPMSDNLPFDFVVFHNKFFKCQVKTTDTKTENNSLCFSLVTNNWSNKETHKYTIDEVDVVICCDLDTIYLFPMSELVDRRTITLRTETPKNGQVKGINFTKDYVISEDRISKIFC